MYIRQMPIPEARGWISATSAQLHLLLMSREILINKRFSTWLLIWSSKTHSYFSKGASAGVTVRRIQQKARIPGVSAPRGDLWAHQGMAECRALQPQSSLQTPFPCQICCCSVLSQRSSLGGSQAEQRTALNSDGCLEWEKKTTQDWKLLLALCQSHPKKSTRCWELCFRGEIQGKDHLAAAGSFQEDYKCMSSQVLSTE